MRGAARRVGCACALALAGPVAAREAGPADDYLLHCSACHGSDGAGTPGVVPSLAELGTLLATPAGREYIVRVPGVAQAPLSDARLARLLECVVSEFSDARAEPAFAPDEVARLRRSPLRDPEAARRRALSPPAR